MAMPSPYGWGGWYPGIPCAGWLSDLWGAIKGAAKKAANAFIFWKWGDNSDSCVPLCALENGDGTYTTLFSDGHTEPYDESHGRLPVIAAGGDWWDPDDVIGVMESGTFYPDAPGSDLVWEDTVGAFLFRVGLRGGKDANDKLGDSSWGYGGLGDPFGCGDPDWGWGRFDYPLGLGGWGDAFGFPGFSDPFGYGGVPAFGGALGPGGGPGHGGPF